MSYAWIRLRAFAPFLSLLLAVTFLAWPAAAQNRVFLRGHRPPQATSENDTGRVSAALTLQNVSIFLKPSATQQADLDAFLARQQDPTSPDYHKWLTPEQFAARFGASQADVDKVVAWLSSENMQSLSVARGRNIISFSGSARQMEHAFGTELHRYSVNGRAHFANASEPSVPASVGGLILSVRGLTDFRLKPYARVRGPKQAPRYTSGSSGNIYVAPDDLATIYDVKPLLSSGIDGTGQKIAVVGQTNIDITDIQTYRKFFNLPPNDPQLILVPGTTDPGISTDDLIEADLDIEIAGAIARNAQILYVYSNNVEVSLQYAISNQVAPVISMSYGLCESATGSNSLLSMRALAQQANAQGQTWIAASGDNGGADCYTGKGRGASGSQLAVDVPASIPEVTGVGGTEFNEGSGTYWATANNANHASALGYIPEMAWNDTAIDGSPAASGGGVSSQFAKPAWQNGLTPSDGFRDVPDVALPSSVDHEGVLVYTNGNLELVGGTSCAAPAFAGMTGLLNHYLIANGLQPTAGLGNVNPRLYALAGSGGVFHDITAGNNVVDGCAGARGVCNTGPVGYTAGPGYDQATGLGSVDVYNLVTSWHQSSALAKPAVTVTLTSSASAIGATDSVTLTAAVHPSALGTATGTVTFYAGGVSLGSAALNNQTAAFTVAGSKLAVGLNTLSANYSGDSTFAAAAGSLSLAVTSASVMSIQGIVNAASGQQAFSPGTIISVYGTLLASGMASAASVPLPTSLLGTSVSVNGTSAPLYFVSPGQINLQIPYTIKAGTIATVAVTFGVNTVTATIPISTASPGVFVDYTTGAPVGVVAARRGQTIALYVTGAGAVTPSVTSGATPASSAVPVPTQSVVVSVGGISTTTFAYLGIPAWAIGLVQINFTIPANAPLGSQPVQVFISGTVSSPANIVITN
jgi:uncharacterized protein (TIGR03437 family)